jgi:SAM-dependent methyltransferase
MQIFLSLLGFFWTLLVKCCTWPYYYYHRLRIRKLFLNFPDNFDELYGTDTRKHGANNYNPTQSNVFNEAVSKVLAIVGGEQFVFIDIGCGHGRVLMLASKFKFKKVIGVEIMYEYCEKAVQNAEIFTAKQHVSPITVDCTDAFWYVQKKWPLDEDVFLFMYCPLIGGELVFANFFNTLQAKLQTSRKKFVLLFVDPPDYLEKLASKSGLCKIAENGMSLHWVERIFFAWQAFGKKE